VLQAGNLSVRCYSIEAGIDLPPKKESSYNVSLEGQKGGANGQKELHSGTDHQDDVVTYRLAHRPSRKVTAVNRVHCLAEGVQRSEGGLKDEKVYQDAQDDAYQDEDGDKPKGRALGQL